MPGGLRLTKQQVSDRALILGTYTIAVNQSAQPATPSDLWMPRTLPRRVTCTYSCMRPVVRKSRSRHASGPVVHETAERNALDRWGGGGAAGAGALGGGGGVGGGGVG